MQTFAGYQQTWHPGLYPGHARRYHPHFVPNESQNVIIDWEYQITGLDISDTFVEIARKNAREEKVDIDFRQGNVSEMPFDDETFDFIFCSSAFKNFSEPVQALNEMHRVLKPNGTALIIDLRRDVSPQQLKAQVNNMGLSKVNTLFTMWTFKFILIRRAYTKNEFEHLIRQTRFTDAKILESPIGFEIWLERGFH